MRDLIFVSHATPEDNNFSLWITLQLAKRGYRVWCDLTNLLGGEDFYDDIDVAISEEAIKFLFVLSHASHNPKRIGPKEELIRAKNTQANERLKDFIIPLSIADVAHKSKHITLAAKNSIPFELSWAAGLNQLLEKLEKDKVPKNERFNPDAVSDWWRKHASVEKGLKDETELLYSNWYLVEEFPRIHVYELEIRRTGQRTSPTFPFPVFKVEDKKYVSFAMPHDFSSNVSGVWGVKNHASFYTIDFVDGISGSMNVIRDRKLRRDAVYYLLNESWIEMMAGKSLCLHDMSNKQRIGYFPSELCVKDKIHFVNLKSKNTYRTVAGAYRNEGF